MSLRLSLFKDAFPTIGAVSYGNRRKPRTICRHRSPKRLTKDINKGGMTMIERFPSWDIRIPKGGSIKEFMIN
jgi:hypothetical protein